MWIEVLKDAGKQLLGMLAVTLALAVVAVGIESCMERTYNHVVDMACDTVEGDSAVAK